jgi:hypothetical protein
VGLRVFFVRQGGIHDALELKPDASVREDPAPHIGFCEVNTHVDGGSLVTVVIDKLAILASDRLELLSVDSFEDVLVTDNGGHKTSIHLS